MDTETRRIYYKTTSKIKLPSNPAWRFWKFVMPDGTWTLVKGITGIKQLRDLLVKHNPQAFYYSTSEFLNVDRIENPGYQVADQLFMQNKYLVIDIDNNFGPETVNTACQEVMLRMSQFSEIYEYEKTIFTGRGIRLEYLDKTKVPDLLPTEKEDWVKRTRKEFCMINLSDIRDVDAVIAWDTRRVIKCEGSPNPHNEYTTTIIASPAYIPAIPGKFQVDETSGGSSVSSLRKQGSATDQESGSSPHLPMYFGKFIRNKVEGTKDRFVLYFEYRKTYPSWRDELKFLQRKYGLSTIYVMDDYMKVICVGIDAVPAKRLDKIYKGSKSLTKRVWEKFQNLYIRTSMLYDQDLNRIAEYDLKPLFKVDNSSHVLYPLSKPHIDFINHLGFDTSSLNTQAIGKDKNTIYQSFFERRKERQCPVCGANTITSCPGGTLAYKTLPIKWICSKCLHEW